MTVKILVVDDEPAQLRLIQRVLTVDSYTVISAGSGPDEYLAKPIGNRELLARVRAALRRAEKSARTNGRKKVLFSNDYLTVDVTQRRVVVNGERVKLTPRAVRLWGVLVGD